MLDGVFFLSLVYDTHGHCKKEGEGFRISSPPPMTGERNGHQRQTLMKTLHDLFVVGGDSLVVTRTPDRNNDWRGQLRYAIVE